MSFMKVARSYTTPRGCRLATFQEAKDNLLSIKKQNLLEGRDRARLLDGWISGPCYDFQIENTFRSCMGYMLVIQVDMQANHSSGDLGRELYQDVSLTEEGKQVALLLCAYDWNYEVVYWLLNSWDKRQTMDPRDVRDGRIPLNYASLTEMIQLNKLINDLARKLGEIFVDEKTSNKKFTYNLLKTVLVELETSVLEKFTKAQKKLLHCTKQNYPSSYSWVDDFWYDALEYHSDSDQWNLTWDLFSAFCVLQSTNINFKIMINKWLKDKSTKRTTSQRNFILAGSILYYITKLHNNFLSRWKLMEYDFSEKSITITCDENFNVLDEILHVAAGQGDVITISKILDCGARALSQNLKKQTALHVAFVRIENEDTKKEVVKILLNKCVAKEQLVNAPDEGGKTALHLASSGGSAKMCKLLLDCRAKPDAKDRRGRLPLHYAVEGKRDEAIEVVTILLERCDAKDQLINSPDEEGKTVLHLASSRGNAEMCRLLLDCGAKPDAKDNRGGLPLHYAVGGKKDEAIEVVRILLDRYDAKKQLVNSPDEEGTTVLHLASSRGNAKICRLLLSCGAKPEAKDNRDRLPLHYAVKEKDDEAIDVLINASDQECTEMLNSRDSYGKSPFDIAVDQNNIKLMARFFPILEQPSQSFFNKVDTSKLLCQFAFEGNTYIVRKLLNRGARPHDVDDDKKTALHHAAMCEDHFLGGETIDLILEKCQDKKEVISKLDKKGKTALHVAAFNANPFVDALKDSVDIRDRDGRIPLYDATQGKLDDPDIIDFLIDMMEEKGISIDDLIDTTGLTPLHMAASQGKVFQVDALLKRSEHPRKYVKRADYLGQTALHKAAKGGHEDTIKVLLYWGAQPLLERDCDGRTALHYAVQTETEEDGIALAELLLKKCGSKERKLLFLWASAAGLGTAEQNLSDCRLKSFLLVKKEELSKETDNLLRTAARMGDTEMAKELLIRGCQIADIQHSEWIGSLEGKQKDNVEKVVKEIKMIAVQGNDRPSVSDNLGRADFAHGLAALLLNPYLNPPIAIGISGNWGMGKSSLMVQTEIILLKTAAQSALLPTLKSPSSILPGVREFELSKVGKKRYSEIKGWVDFLRNKSKFHTNFINAIIKDVQMWIRALKSKESQGKEEDSLYEFLNNYEPEYHKIFKSLAAIDSSDMFIPKGQQSHSRSDSPSEGSVPAIITVRYNAWKYRNESEALAGMAVEITKEMEGIMAEPQWLSTCWRNTWRKQKQTIWIEVIFPFLLAIFLAGTFTWIVWLLLDRYNVKEGVKLKYASLPVTIVIMVWTLVKSVMSTVKPVSSQLMNYIKFPDHTEKLGYQERVISDITFLKGEVRRKPYFLCTAASCIWHLITRCFMISYLCPKFLRENMANSTAASTSTSYASDNPRIIVFVDDLDRCQESVILQVLSAINLVLAACEISAIVGMDKVHIHRAIRKMYGDKSLKNKKELADKYLQKIIQLPLDLPDPSKDESKSFLKSQLGVFSKQLKDEDGEPETDVDDDSKSEIDAYYNALFSPFDTEDQIEDLGDRLKEMFSEDRLMPGERDSHPQTEASDVLAVVVTNANGANAESSGEPSVLQREGTDGDVTQKERDPSNQVANANAASDQSCSESIPIREMLFVRYSVGEHEAFFYFQEMATDWRKLPRQWKCLLYYHRLIWYIFSMSDKARSLDGWQLQLITWIFVCWEWEENMNILIQNWGILKTYKSESESGSNGPSLRAIVEHYIENEDKDKKTSATGDAKHKDKVSEESKSTEIKAEEPKEDLKEKDVSRHITEEMKAKGLEEDLKAKGISKNTEEPECSNKEAVQLKAIDEDEMATTPDSQNVFKRSEEGYTVELLEHYKNKDSTSAKLEGGMKEKYISINMSDDDDESSNIVVNKLKEFVNRAISEKLDDVVKTLRKELDEVKKEIRDLKETKQQTRKNKKSDEEEETRRNNWQKMKAALKKYDVSMKGIQAFQRFRFYCVAGHLPWPLPKEETEVS